MNDFQRYGPEIASGALASTYLVFLVYFIAPRVSSWVVVRGLYPVVGVLIGYSVYYYDAHERRTPSVPRFSTAEMEKVSLIVALLYVSALVTFNFRWLPLVVPLLVVTYAFVRAAAIDDSGRALRLVILAYILPLITKVVATGYYFGGADMIKDFNEADRFLHSNSVAALPGWYQSFPVTYLLNGSISELTSLPIYYSYHVGGIVAFSVVPMVIFSLLKKYVDERTSIAGSFSVVVLYPFAYFPTHWYPPSMSAVLFVFILYFGSRSTEGRRFLSLGIVALVILVLNHHLSMIFVLNILFLYELIRLTPIPRTADLDLLPAHITRLMLLFTMTYWLYTTGGRSFLQQVVVAVLTILKPKSGQAATLISISGVETFFLPPSYDILDSVVWLATPDGAVNILYVALILLSGIWLYLHTSRPPLVFVVPGLFGFLFVLKTPFTLPGIFRARLFWAIASVFYMMFGVRYLIDNIRINRGVSLSLVVLLMLAVVTPLSAADDVNELRPDVEKIGESSFSEAEVQGMDSSTRFVASYVEQEVATFHLTRVFLNQRHPALSINTLNALFSRECGETYLLYRSSWADNVVTYAGMAKGNASRGQQYISNESRIAEMEASSHRVFTNGRIGMVRERC